MRHPEVFRQFSDPEAVHLSGGDLEGFRNLLLHRDKSQGLERPGVDPDMGRIGGPSENSAIRGDDDGKGGLWLPLIK